MEMKFLFLIPIKIKIFNKEGTFLRKWTSFITPSAITVSSSLVFLFTVRAGIQAYSKTGVFVYSFLSEYDEHFVGGATDGNKLYVITDSFRSYACKEIKIFELI